MEFNAKKRIEFHGNAIRKEIANSIIRMLCVLLVVAFILSGRLSLPILLLMAFYAFVVISSASKKIKRHKMFYTFEQGNPTYDTLSEFGNPEEILSEINEQVNSGRVIYSEISETVKLRPETVITESYFVHLNKRATVIPLDKIVCAYVYDATAQETPHERQMPSRFKPLYFVITYGKSKEAVFIYSAIDYSKILELLDQKLACKVIYTRELRKLYETDYAAFLEKLAEVKAQSR